MFGLTGRVGLWPLLGDDTVTRCDKIGEHNGVKCTSCVTRIRVHTPRVYDTCSAIGSRLNSNGHNLRSRSRVSESLSLVVVRS